MHKKYDRKVSLARKELNDLVELSGNQKQRIATARTLAIMTRG